MSQSGGSTGQNYVWDVGTLSWVKEQQPILNAGSVTVSGTITANQGTPNTDANGWPIKITDGTHGEVAVTAANALKVDGSAVTQPVSGTVTANAGTGTFNTSDSHTTAAAPLSVELSDGGAFYVAAKTGQLPGTLDGSGFLKVHEQGTATISGTVTANQGGSWTVTANAGTGTFNTAHATTADARIRNPGDTAYMGDVTTPVRVDPTGTTTQPVSGTVTTTPPANASTNVTQFGGNAVVTGTGASGSGIPRVTVSNDSNILATQSGAWSVTANQGGSWTVTANAGTNLNTSALALEAGGNLAAAKADLDTIVTNTGNIDTDVKAVQVTAGTTTAPTRIDVVAGKTNDSTPQYQPLPEGPGGRSVIVEGVTSGVPQPVVQTTPAFYTSPVADTIVSGEIQQQILEQLVMMNEILREMAGFYGPQSLNVADGKIFGNGTDRFGVPAGAIS